MAIPKDITGQRFGRLVAIKLLPKRRGTRTVWLCQCDCGSVHEAMTTNLDKGATKSCGCLNLDNLRSKNGCPSGMSGTPTYRSWRAMLFRCSNPKSGRRYCARGIKVDQRWKRFDNFLADMGERPLGTSIDRIDNNGNYEPGNCRWADRYEQGRNRDTSRLITFNGKTQNVTDWARELGLNRNMLYKQLDKGVPVVQALTSPNISAIRR